MMSAQEAESAAETIFEYKSRQEVESTPGIRALFIESYRELDRVLEKSHQRTAGELSDVFDWELKEDNHKFLLASDATRAPLGVAIWRLLETPPGLYLSQLAVAKGRWRQGIGAKLLAKLSSDFPQQSVYCLIRKENEVSRCFFDHLRAEAWDDPEEWPDEYLMPKELYYTGFVLPPLFSS